MSWWIVPAAGLAGYVGFLLGEKKGLAAAAPRRETPRPDASRLDASQRDASRAPGTPAAAANATAASSGATREQLLQLARELNDVYEVIAHPDDLRTQPSFARAVELLSGDALPLDDLFGYLVGDNSALACAAAAATEHRAELQGREHELVPRLDGISIYARTFLLRTIARSAAPDTAIAVLLASNGSWGSAMGRDLLRGYVRERLDAELLQQPAVRRRFTGLDEAHVGWLRDTLEPLDSDAARALLTLLGDRSAAGVDLKALRGFATVLDADESFRLPLGSPTQEQAFVELQRALHRDPPRSLLLVGPRGVGKSVLAERLARELCADGWTVFTAGATQLLAGQSYIGQLEQRVVDLVRAVGGRPRVLWVAPDLAEFLTAGRTMQSPTGLLDLLLPHLVRGELRILAPMTSAAAELLLRQSPLLRQATVTVRLGEAGSEETLQMAREWLQRGVAAGGAPWCDDAVLAEVFQRAQQHVVDQQRPGSLLSTLAALREHVTAGAGNARPATLDDVIALLSRLTGLPPVVLDERDGLDLDSVRRAFAARVMGQPEAVDCLVERIAMLKAGLCDPRRPVGVFLFTGPTGTGKTELCRALAAYLFGSEQRLLRLDMSEFQQPESIARLVGDADDVHGRRALVHEVREQPFSVVLLDEIEKAHPLVFDLFLQVFDEGRLTDRRGRVADFRHTIVILTSNLGVKSLEGAGLGFGGGGPDLQRALEEVFRREFLNRIDRVVVFRALDRDTLRDVLKKELDLVLQRRGLRSRPWAVEWDESALQFLLQQGYSEALGARPLRRAIERHVLAPLASAIVTDCTPAGDQFLFVRSDGRAVRVEFVDPDAEVAPDAAAALEPCQRGLRELARDAVGSADELLAVQRELDELLQRVGEETWTRRKADAYEAMGGRDFWTSDGRHAVLGLIELKSRIEEAVQGAHERVAGMLQQRGAPNADEVRDRAARALLLQLAIAAVEHDEPQDAYLSIAPLHDVHGDAAATRAFATRLVGMYRAWARRRGMQWRELEGGGGAAGGAAGGVAGGVADGGALLAVTGFAAWPLLRLENGLHVFDLGDPGSAGGGVRPCRVRVTVVPQPPVPATGDAERMLARSALQPAAASTPVIVRRYREVPSPEVRDRVRGWRSGRLDRVLGGEFDVIE
ncbi:MAG: ATP-dependent Clp protease ATP-binding subunit [Planctomycetes bacterium]|nr:ATP-dependent Clp protease ATP-binding subunit [Planctomycetota bacterium]